MRLLSMLMPQERRFFALFNQHASLVVDGAATLIEMLDNYSDNGRRDEFVAKIQSRSSIRPTRSRTRPSS